MAMQKTVGELIAEVQAAFASAFAIPADFLISEYNAIVRLTETEEPSPNAEVTATVAADGKLQTEIAPAQVRRIFFGAKELLRASMPVFTLIPGPLYAVDGDGLYVQEAGEYRICYRAYSPEVTVQNAASTPIPLDVSALPMLRAYLYRRAYLFVGDTACAEVSGAEYEKLYAAYRKAHGVNV